MTRKFLANRNKETDLTHVIVEPEVISHFTGISLRLRTLRKSDGIWTTEAEGTLYSIAGLLN